MIGTVHYSSLNRRTALLTRLHVAIMLFNHTPASERWQVKEEEKESEKMKTEKRDWGQAEWKENYVKREESMVQLWRMQAVRRDITLRFFTEGAEWNHEKAKEKGHNSLIHECFLIFSFKRKQENIRKPCISFTHTCFFAHVKIVNWIHMLHPKRNKSYQFVQVKMKCAIMKEAPWVCRLPFHLNYL